jgi:hypothetical protein
MGGARDVGAAPCVSAVRTQHLTFCTPPERAHTDVHMYRTCHAKCANAFTSHSETDGAAALV